MTAVDGSVDDAEYTPDETRKLCEYRMGMCREYNSFYADAESGEEQLGLPGRVFLHQFPESIPFVMHYSLKEYPQRNLAVRCCNINGSCAVPVFDHSSHTCVGVLEIVSLHFPDPVSYDKSFLGQVYDIFQCVFKTRELHVPISLQEFGLLCFDGYKHYEMQSSYTANDIYVLEFFLPTSERYRDNSWTSLSLILGTMDENFRTFKLASGQELGDLLSVQVIDFQNGQKLDFIQKIQAKDGGETLQLGHLDQPPMDAISNGTNVVSEAQNYNLPSFEPLQSGKVTMQLDSSDQLSIDHSKNAHNVITTDRNVMDARDFDFLTTLSFLCCWVASYLTWNS
ncbi:hypothetical protein RHSIM_RhsimUnG0163900 [Rhododendron simsii]|uniref:NLP1-9 GAF domain-containing protein n=1 Tax=Rhododendron simsii TaxID=118357 RepID=A0A834FUB0_RHOSS|nr:hypothetical protein RHSIM_RhsimUnG0163900 [Rhododendron simsii]